MYVKVLFVHFRIRQILMLLVRIWRVRLSSLLNIDKLRIRPRNQLFLQRGPLSNSSQQNCVKTSLPDAQTTPTGSFQHKGAAALIWVPHGGLNFSSYPCPQDSSGCVCAPERFHCMFALCCNARQHPPAVFQSVARHSTTRQLESRYTPMIYNETKQSLVKLQRSKLMCLSSTQVGWRCCLQTLLSAEASFWTQVICINSKPAHSGATCR